MVYTYVYSRYIVLNMFYIICLAGFTGQTDKEFVHTGLAFPGAFWAPILQLPQEKLPANLEHLRLLFWAVYFWQLTVMTDNGMTLDFGFFP